MFGRRLWSRWVVGVLCTSALLLAGCGDFFNKDGGAAGAAADGQLCLRRHAEWRAGGYSVSTTGALATLSGSPNQFATAEINALAVTPGNKFLYAGVSGIGVYGLGIASTTGVTTLINTMLWYRMSRHRR